MKREAKASGISPSFSELDQLIEECIEVEKLEQDLRQKDGDSASSKTEKERENALEMRRIAMETFGESKKRKKEEEEENSTISKKKKSRNSGNDTIEYLREKNTKEMSIREKELQMKEKQQELEKQRYESMMHLIQQQQQQQLQQQQQQQQQQQFQVMMKQQSQLLMNMLQQVNKWKES
ncbi:UPF0746 protein DDB_G0281095-like [Acropora millepora]|uniref:UPF0746 protein DDB_G0281095-like n=1 Tax=Acropora millepora TaxID=45264 RepID=UPI001CF44C90|nr:UPF0746 protein DDB_G0281095-like [Acropora millepora]